VRNLAGGVMNLRGVAFANFGGAVFTNQGTINVVNTNTVTIGMAFNNQGNVTVTNGTLTLNAGGVQSGLIEVQAAGTNLFVGGTFTFNPGAAFAGTGTARFRSAIVLATPLNFGALQVYFESSASISGAFNLANAAGGALVFNKSLTVPGSLTVAGTLTLTNAGFTVTVTGAFTLETGATLNNPGTVQVGAFVNNGGTINGNAPVVLGPRPLQIDNVGLSDPAKARAADGSSAPAGTLEVVLDCRGRPGQQFVVEVSTDLTHWMGTAALIQETAPGRFRATVSATGGARFFRLRALP
jgi:hypothetical protein